MRPVTPNNSNSSTSTFIKYGQLFNFNAGWTVGEITLNERSGVIQGVLFSHNSSTYTWEDNFHAALARASDPWDRQMIKDVQDGSIDRLLEAMAEEDDKLEEF